MRSTRILKWSVLAAMCTALVVVLAGCPKHENLPTTLEVVTSAAPDSFRVTALGPNSSGTFDYDLTWQTSDASVVDRYRLYLVGGGFLPELVYETSDAEESQLMISVTVPTNAEGLQFGLSSVSTGWVESAMSVATIPPPPPPN